MRVSRLCDSFNFTGEEIKKRPSSDLVVILLRSGVSINEIKDEVAINMDDNSEDAKRSREKYYD